MTRVGVSLLALAGFASFAHAADLPARNATPSPAPPSPPSCFSSLWTWLNASADACPLTYGGFTLYGTIDAGYGFEVNGAPFNPSFGPGDAYLISKATSGRHWLWSPNALSSSVLGVKMSEPLGAGWSLVGDLEFGFDPYSFQLSNSPRSLVENNGLPLLLQSANGDSSRAGQFDNSQGYLGLSHPAFGTLTAGRVNTLTLDAISAYDPMSASNAFSPIGWSGSFAGFGDTEAARGNTAVKYRWQYANFRLAGLAQVGGYDQGNGAADLAQAQIGADVGAFSFDAIGGFAKDAVSLGNYTALPKKTNQGDLKATLSDNYGVMLVGKYTWGPIKLYGGYENYRQTNPSGVYPFGFTSLGGFTVLPNAITYNAYNINRHVNVLWTGIKIALTDQVDVTSAFYYQTQNDYYAKPCKGTGIYITSNACAGQLDAVSFLIDYHPVKRLDLYAGVMVSNVYGGSASGYVAPYNIDPTVGLRVKF